MENDISVTFQCVDNEVDNSSCSKVLTEQEKLAISFNNLREAEKNLEEVLFQAVNKLEKSSASKSVDLEKLIHYSHYISVDHSVAAPLNWEQGDPRRPYPTENEMRSGWLGRLNELSVGDPIPSELITEAVPESVRFPPTEETRFYGPYSENQREAAKNIIDTGSSTSKWKKGDVDSGGADLLTFSSSSNTIQQMLLGNASAASNEDVETMSTDSSDSN